MATTQRYAQIKEFSEYKKDTKTGAVVFDNKTQYNQFVAKKEKERTMLARLDRLENTLDVILTQLEKINARSD